MRLALLILVLLTGPALAAIGWSRYDNARFGYAGGVPQGFSGYGESDNGDGQTFDHPTSRQVLSYWGSMILQSGFAEEVASAIGSAERDGWAISFQAETPEWASFTGVMGQSRFHMRMILLCDRISVASMRLQYTAAQAADVKPMIEELEAEFSASGC
jgi:hypothetical protein